MPLQGYNVKNSGNLLYFTEKMQDITLHSKPDNDVFRHRAEYRDRNTQAFTLEGG